MSDHSEEEHPLTGNIVGEALVRYINQGITVGSVNMPETQLRSLTLEEENTARVRHLIGRALSIDALTMMTGYLHSQERAWCAA
jgi:hypothetical protein